MSFINKIVRKIVAVFLLVILLMFINTIQSNAANIDANLNSEFDYKINFGRKIVSCDIELQFDFDKLEIARVETNNTDYNEIENGKVIIVYADETGVGIDKLSIKFKTKKTTPGKETAKIFINNINAYSLSKDEQYSKEQFNVEKLLTEIRILEQKESNTVETNNNSKEVNLNIATGILPFTGSKGLEILAISIVIIAVITK